MSPSRKSLKPINLQLGWPSPYLVPRQALLAASQAVLSSPLLTEEASIYGPDPGSQSVRRHVAEWLQSHFHPNREHPITADRILISNGASATLAQILLKFSDPVYTRRVWMVEPTYFLACPVFEDAGLEGRLRGVPEDDEGIDIEYLRRQLRKVDTESEKDQSRNTPYKTGSNYPKLYRHIIYCVPSFSNPSAKTMSIGRRKQLVELARQYDALIIADDVYDLLRWPTPPHPSTAELGPLPPRLIDIDGSHLPYQSSFGNTVSNGSFSKLIAPGTRVSWVEATPSFIQALSTVGYTRSGGAGSQMSSILVSRLLTSGELDDHITKVLIPTYSSRSRAMLSAIEKYLLPLGVCISTGSPYVSAPNTSSTPSANGQHAPESLKQSAPFAPQSGGFFTYLLFPPHLPPASEISNIARTKYALKIAYGQMMTISGDEGSNERVDPRGCRLSWSWHSEQTIVRGVKRLAQLLKELDGKNSEDNGYEEDGAEDSGEESGVDAYFQSN